MKQQVSQKAVIAAIAVVLLVVAFFGWRTIKGPDVADEAEAQYRKIEAQYKAQGKDVRSDPMLAPLYYKYHPEEKPPAGQMPNPMVPPGARTGMDAVGSGPAAMPLAPPPMRSIGGQ